MADVASGVGRLVDQLVEKRAEHVHGLGLLRDGGWLRPADTDTAVWNAASVANTGLEPETPERVVPGTAA